MAKKAVVKAVKGESCDSGACGCPCHSTSHFIIGFGLAIAGLLMLVDKAGFMPGNSLVGYAVGALIVIAGLVFLLKGFCKCCKTR